MTTGLIKLQDSLITKPIMTNIAVFASGNGSNCENIIRYFEDSESICIRLVLCNNRNAKVMQRASLLGVPAEYVDRISFRDASTVMPLMQKYGIDFIVLAGFLQLVPAFLIEAYSHRIINIHPALLPKFGGKGMYGHHVHEAVKAAGETETGITVHWVTEKYDDGGIIAQFRTPLSPTDTPDDIAGKIHVLEMEHFPKVIEEVIRNRRQAFMGG